jgi:hypothetical protein
MTAEVFSPFVRPLVLLGVILRPEHFARWLDLRYRRAEGLTPGRLGGRLSLRPPSMARAWLLSGLDHFGD